MNTKDVIVLADGFKGNNKVLLSIMYFKDQIINNISSNYKSLKVDINNFKIQCTKPKLQVLQTNAKFLDMGILEDHFEAQTMIPLPGNI